MKDETFDRARERFDRAVDADYQNRIQGLDDLEFVTGEGQWPQEERAEREAAGRPCITINRMPQFLRQVTGDIRATNPAIDVIPGDAEASDEMADLVGGIIRHIEYQSDASSVYERAAESAAACGIGHWRVYPVTTDAGDQELRIESIPNPFAVYWDPLSKDPSRKDAEYCFVTEEITIEEFKEKYPKADVYDFESDGIPQHLRNWTHGEFITVAEYFEKRDGKVYWSKLSGTEVIDGPTEFPSKHIPVFAVCGEELHVGERVVRTSVVRYAKDAQRLYNYWRSAQAELIALQPKAPYKLTARQINGYESFWNQANTANLPYLLYNPDNEAPGAPQREMPPVPSQGMMQEIALAADDLKATTGIYDAALGERSNETSGVAIRQRQLEADVSTSIYVDNLSKSIRQCGVVMVDMIPRIYDTTRAVRTVAPDGSSAVEQINVPQWDEYGQVIYANDLSRGMFDVRIQTGPSYSTQRQEAVERMTQLMQAWPQVAPMVGDLVVRNMDFPGADAIADRLYAMLPPELRNEEGATPEQMQIQALMQQNQKLQAMLEQITQQPEFRRAEAQAAKAEADAQRAAMQVQQQGLQVQEQGLEVEEQALVNDGRRLDMAAQRMQAMMPQPGPSMPIRR